MFLDSDLTRSFIFDPLLVLLREIDIFHWGWNNGNFPLEINSRSINIFPYFWRIFSLVVFFIYNNYNYFFFFDFDFNFFLSYFYFKQYFEEYDSNKNSLEKEQNCIELEIDSFEIF